jgi:hypothetical protein
MAAAAIVPLALGNAWNVGRMAMQALPYITALYGASEGAKEGGLLGALTGGGLGYLGGRVGTGYVTKGAKAAEKAAPGLASRALGLKKGETLKPNIANVVKAAGYTAVPLAAAGLAAPLVGRLAGSIGGLTGDLGGAVAGTGGNVLGAGTGISQALTKPSGGLPTIDPTSGLPTGAAGTAELLNPLNSVAGALAVERQLQDLQLEGIKKLTPYEYGVLSQMKKDDLARTLAGARGRQDIATQAQLIQQGQLGQQAMARQALADIGAGLRTQYNYG